MLNQFYSLQYELQHHARGIIQGDGGSPSVGVGSPTRLAHSWEAVSVHTHTHTQPHETHWSV